MLQSRDQEQWWLLGYMKSLGYFRESDPQALCQGVAGVAMHAILAEDIPLFYQRFAVILTIPVEAFAQAVKLAEEQHHRLITVAQFRTQEEKKFYELVESQLTEQERACLDFKALCDSLAAYQSPFSLPMVFDRRAGLRQDLQAALAVVTPVKLEQEGGVARPEHFSGSYTLPELSLYFQSLQQSLTGFSHPVAMVLRNTIHAITIGYDDSTKKFILINANRLVKEEVNEGHKTLRVVEPKWLGAEELAVAVIPALFSTNNIAAFETSFFIAKKHADELQPALSQWKQQKLFQEMPSKSKQLDSHGIGLLYLAAYTGDTALLESSLQNGADPNQLSSENGASPLFMAVQGGYQQIVRILLAQGALANLNRQAGGPLHIAALAGDIEITTDLLNAGALVNQENAYGFIALAFAAMQGNLQMTIELLAHGAIPDHAAKNGSTPIQLALAFNHPEIVNLLTEARDQRIQVIRRESQERYDIQREPDAARQLALQRIQETVMTLTSISALEAARDTFENLDKLAKSLQKLISSYKPINSELKLLVGFLKSKIDLAYKTYAESASGAENKAMNDLSITAKLVRDEIRENTSQPGFFRKLFRKGPNPVDPLEIGITQIIESKLLP